ncbi:killer cell lectin-like receptor subfamily B member 1B allele B isoform X1 [Hemitrygon akajei]|uniref:killer cell lectin-like receptor subfamily B member 1B allele B isoform X1 n=1 Tax=Hemitrygon akajei TaxID=2704970 RepID=UPI003BF9DEFE
MDRSESYMNVKLGKADSRSPCRAEPDVLYAEVNFKSPSAPRVRADRDGLNSTYSELNVRKGETRIDEDEDSPISSGPGGLPTTAPPGPHTEQPKDKISNKPYRKICLLCLVTSVIIAMVAGLSIYVLQIRQSQITCDQNYQTLCQFLNSNREQECSQDWIRNEERCYLISTLETSYDEVKKYCSSIDAMLLEINSEEQKNVVSKSLVDPFRTYWIGKCENGKAASSLMHRDDTGRSACGNCNSYEWNTNCQYQHRFICEKSAHWFMDIPEKILDLCQQPLEPN